MARSKIILLFLFILITDNGQSQAMDESHITFSFAKESMATFKELLAIPNDANFPDDIEKNVAWCSQKLAEYNFVSKRLETATVPLLLATQKETNTKLPTILFYFHIDGQPTDPSFWFRNEWK